MQPSPNERGPYNGLTRAEPTLPSSAYWDIAAYQRDLEAIWYRNWLLV
ncbi:MAG: aromatic ring-hydroxylating dioxygenase subunit alpha, partial [Mesorhizobium sp.]